MTQRLNYNGHEMYFQMPGVCGTLKYPCRARRSLGEICLPECQLVGVRRCLVKSPCIHDRHGHGLSRSDCSAQ